MLTFCISSQFQAFPSLNIMDPSKTLHYHSHNSVKKISRVHSKNVSYQYKNNYKQELWKEKKTFKDLIGSKRFFLCEQTKRPHTFCLPVISTEAIIKLQPQSYSFFNGIYSRATLPLILLPFSEHQKAF